MVIVCAAYGCSSKGGDRGVSFHKFPNDAVLREKWVTSLRRKYFVPSVNSRLCSKHFKNEDITLVWGRPIVRPEAVPCNFNFDSVSRSPKTKKKLLANNEDLAKVPSKVGEEVDVKEEFHKTNEGSSSGTVSETKSFPLPVTKAPSATQPRASTFILIPTNNPIKSFPSTPILVRPASVPTALPKLISTSQSTSSPILVQSPALAKNVQNTTPQSSGLILLQSPQVPSLQPLSKPIAHNIPTILPTSLTQLQSNSFRQIAQNISNILPAPPQAYNQLQRHSKQKRYLFLHDFQEEDMKNYELAKKMFQISTQLVESRTRQIKKLRLKMDYYKNKLKYIEDAKEHLQLYQKLTKQFSTNVKDLTLWLKTFEDSKMQEMNFEHIYLTYKVTNSYFRKFSDRAHHLQRQHKSQRIGEIDNGFSSRHQEGDFDLDVQAEEGVHNSCAGSDEGLPSQSKEKVSQAPNRICRICLDKVPNCIDLIKGGELCEKVLAVLPDLDVARKGSEGICVPCHDRVVCSFDLQLTWENTKRKLCNIMKDTYEIEQKEIKQKRKSSRKKQNNENSVSDHSYSFQPTQEKEHTTGDHKCAYCDMRFYTEVRLVEHFQVHRPLNICSICGKAGYSDNKEFVEHNCQEHLASQAESVTKSNDAGDETAYNDLLESHHVTAEDEEAKISRNKLSNGNEVEENKEIHHSVSEDQGNELCDLCGKSFPTQKHLQQHVVRMHFKTRDYLCQICGKQTYTRKALRDHTISKHSNDKPFKCNICGKGYFFHSSLKRHEPQHLSKNDC